MIKLKTICVGKLKEPYYMSACLEYEKRLKAYAKTEIHEIKEELLPVLPSKGQIEDALKEEGRRIIRLFGGDEYILALCAEGTQLKSEEFADMLFRLQSDGISKICFVIGGSNGLSEEVKEKARFCLSMSKMTFPHHLARVMLLEQLYRSFQIISGGKYHK